jgi:hypothetical protein
MRRRTSTRAFPRDRRARDPARRPSLILTATPLAAQEGSPFFGEWCGVETRLWVGTTISASTSIWCANRAAIRRGRAPSFSTRVTCANLYIEGEGEDVRLMEVPVDYITSITFTLTDTRRDVYRPR